MKTSLLRASPSSLVWRAGRGPREGSSRGTHDDDDAHAGNWSRDAMEPMLERVRSLLLIPILIASRDASYLPTITPGSTRQELRRTLGDPESSETRGDGTRVERYHIHIRRKVASAWKGIDSYAPHNVGYGAILTKL